MAASTSHVNQPIESDEESSEDEDPDIELNLTWNDRTAGLKNITFTGKNFQKMLNLLANLTF